MTIECRECGSSNVEVTKRINNGSHGTAGANEWRVSEYECHDCHGTGTICCAECGELRGRRHEPCPNCGSERIDRA